MHCHFLLYSNAQSHPINVGIWLVGTTSQQSEHKEDIQAHSVQQKDEYRIYINAIPVLRRCQHKTNSENRKGYTFQNIFFNNSLSHWLRQNSICSSNKKKAKIIHWSYLTPPKSTLECRGIVLIIVEISQFMTITTG